MERPTVRSNHNVVFQCALHVVWSPKHRRSVLIPPVDEHLKKILLEVILEQSLALQALEVIYEDVHLLVDVDSRFGVRQLVNAPKGRSSRLPRHEFLHLRHLLLTLWTNAYFVAITGGAPQTTTKQYVENQKRV